jgi:hypothetical protein
MSPRFGGRDRFRRDHDRARELAAARLGEPLSAEESGWLQAHLAWCAPCRAVAAEYDTQRISLRALRLDAPVPPRDLWARTFSAIEAEEGVRPVMSGGGAQRGSVRGRQQLPVAPLAALLVMVVAVGVSLLNGTDLLTQQGSGSPQPGSGAPGATPFAVAAREIPLVRRTDDGMLVLQVGRVDEVCPLGTAECSGATSLDRREIGRIDAGEASDVLLSPTRSHLVVLDRSAGGGVFVVAMADIPAPSSSPAVTPGPDLTSDPTATASPAPESTPSPEPPTSPAASAPPTAEPPTPAPTAVTTPSPEPGASEPPGSAEPPSTPPVETSPAETEAPVEVSPTPGGAISIADGVVLVGAVAGYAPDGSALAFTARPADGSHGPDVYVWRPSDDQAVAVTSDHDVVFADWIGTRLLVSRAVASDDGTPAAPVSVILDLETGEETAVDVEAMWRPAVDPLARAAVWWDGTVVRDASSFTWVPSAGRLVIGAWPSRAPAAPDPSPDADGATAGPTATPSLPATVTLAAAPVLDWHVRWDETGSRLAVWISEPGAPGTGRLSLYLIDPATGMLADAEPLLRDVVAREGFSLGSGRLAWTSPTDDGGTVVEVLAWSEGSVGQVRITPTDELVVVR